MDAESESIACSSITHSRHNVDVDLASDHETNATLSVMESFTPQTSLLCGRSSETLALLKAYQTVLQKKHTRHAFVHGESGCGKTALVDGLRDTLCASRGFFVTGKYFQNSSVQEPYSAVMAAFSDLCDLVTQSDDFTELKRQKIKEGLGSDDQLCRLLKSVSNLSSIVGGATEDIIHHHHHQQHETTGKFKVACKTFLHAMASNDHPVVVFLDDIQWADEGSTQLIEMFLQDSELKNVLLILAYRDEEAANAQKILSHARDPVDIQLSNLDSGAVFQMVSAVIGGTTNLVNARGLSELVKKRSCGNPFHVNVFMETIQRERLLTFDDHTSSWVFNVEEIQLQIMASESLADLLARKIELLPSDTIDTLKVASLLGYHFDESVVTAVTAKLLNAKRSNIRDDRPETSMSIVSESAGNVVKGSLSEAVKEGLIEPISNGYNFTHDKVQSSVQCLVSETEEEDIRILIGNVFLAAAAAVGANDRTKLIFNAAVHLNRTSAFLHNPVQRVELAKINLESFKYCVEKSGFIRAASMLRKGLEAIELPVRWSAENFELTFGMMESLARTQVTIGDYEGAKETTREALSHCTTVERNINLLMMNLEVRMSGVKPDETALNTVKQTLEVLGVKIPQKVKLWHIMAKLFKVRRMLKGKRDEDLLFVSLKQDTLSKHRVLILLHMFVFCLGKGKKNDAIYAALLAMELTVQNGLIANSAGALAFYGVLEMALGNIDVACRYGKLAVAALDKISDEGEEECRTVGFLMILVLCWKESFRQMVDPLFHVAKSGFQHGNVLYATHCYSQGCHMHRYIGTNLATLEASMRSKYALVSTLSKDSITAWFLQPALQYVLNMQSHASNWDYISVLTGEIMDQGDYLEKVANANHKVLMEMSYLIAAETACYFDQHSCAAEIFARLEAMDQNTISLSYVAPVFFWNAARTYYGLFELSGKRQHSSKARKYRRLLQKMNAKGCPNAAPLEYFLVAQESALAKKINDADLHAIYRHGIEQMVDAEMVHLEGLLNEKAGIHFARRGRRAEAERYFERAMSIYQYDWGAIAKFNWLHEKREAELRNMPLIDSFAEAPLLLCGTCIDVKYSVVDKGA